MHDAFAMTQNIVVPEGQYSPALAGEIGVAMFVARMLPMLRAVGFDDQPGADAKEVDNVGADRDLPAKLEAAEAPVAQQTPEAMLRIGRRAPHCASTRAFHSPKRLHRSSRVALTRPRSRAATFSPREKGKPRWPRSPRA